MKGVNNEIVLCPWGFSLSPHIVLEKSEIPFELEKVDLQVRETVSGRDFIEGIYSRAGTR